MYRQTTHSAPAYNEHRVQAIKESMTQVGGGAARNRFGSALIELGQRIMKPPVTAETQLGRVA